MIIFQRRVIHELELQTQIRGGARMGVSEQNTSPACQAGGIPNQAKCGFDSQLCCVWWLVSNGKKIIPPFPTPLDESISKV